jgi:hypothetical protein
VDLIEWLLSQGAKVRKGGQEYCVNCPKCNDVKGHLYINPSLGVGHCFRCGYSGKVEEILVDGFGLSFKDVRGLVRSYKRFMGNVVANKGKVERVEFPEGSVVLGKVGKGVEWLVREWCKESNVRYEDLVEMGCRWWGGRLVIPCWRDGSRRELWYWVARAVKDMEMKYMNCAVPKKGVVWGMDWYDVSDGYLYVCEGWKDGYRMRGVALLGKDVSDEQVRVIDEIARGKVVRVLLDRDAWRDCVVVGMRIGRVVGYDRVEVGFLRGLRDPGEGKDREEVLKVSEFLRLSDGVGRMIEVIRSFMFQRIEGSLKVLSMYSNV